MNDNQDITYQEFVFMLNNTPYVQYTHEPINCTHAWKINNYLFHYSEYEDNWAVIRQGGSYLIGSTYLALLQYNKMIGAVQDDN